MPSPVPATHLILAGRCSASCLLAAASSGECDCVCGGEFHAALQGATVLVNRPITGPARPLLADVLAVLGVDERAHSEVLLARLEAQWPENYAGWSPSSLARALTLVGVRTRQLWQTTADGGVNRRGVVRTEVLDALANSSSAAS